MLRGNDTPWRRAMEEDLRSFGERGKIAQLVLRVLLYSGKAKNRQEKNGRGNKSSKAAYDRKRTCIAELVERLESQHLIEWGWRKDPFNYAAKYVLVIVLRTGIVAFHTTERLSGPDTERIPTEKGAASIVTAWIDGLYRALASESSAIRIIRPSVDRSESISAGGDDFGQSIRKNDGGLVSRFD